MNTLVKKRQGDPSSDVTGGMVTDVVAPLQSVDNNL